MDLTRREALALMIGAPVLAGGCAPVVKLPPTGQLYGQSHEVGHRLRGGYRPRPADNQWQDVPVVIVGGGAAGLSAAWKLKSSGYDNFVVLELEEVCGGTSRAGRCETSAFPWGAHYIPAPLPENRALIELLTEMGVVESVDPDGSPVIGEQILCREPEERLFFQGEWIEDLYPSTGASVDDLAQWSAFQHEIDRWTDWRDVEGRRAFTIPTSNASTDSAVLSLDSISMADWLRDHGWTSSRLHWYVDYTCRDDYGLTAAQTSAWAGLLYFAGRRKAAGADAQPLMTWPEGNGRITEFLAEQAGHRVKTGRAVTQVTPVQRDGREWVEVICFETSTQTVTGYRAEHVIFAAPQFLAPRLIDGFSERTARQTIDFEYGSWFVANLQLKGRPHERHFPLCWDNVIYESPSLGYVVATHQAGQDHGPAVLTWYYSLSDENTRAQREYLFRATWQELADIVLADLERPHPDIRDLVSQLDIFRWGHAMIRPRVGFVSNPHRKAAQQPDGKIHFANTDLSGVALFEEAFDHGCRAAREVLASHESA